jgi:hypothetical protein
MHHRVHLIADGNRVDSVTYSPVLIVSVSASLEIDACTPRRHGRADIQRGILPYC